MHQAVEQVALHGCHRALAHRVHQRLLHEGGQRPHHDHTEHRERNQHQHVGALVEEDEFDRRIEQIGKCGRHPGGHDHAGDRQPKRPPLSLEVTAHQPPHDGRIAHGGGDPRARRR